MQMICTQCREKGSPDKISSTPVIKHEEMIIEDRDNVPLRWNGDITACAQRSRMETNINLNQ